MIALVSINKSKIFFEKFKLGLCVIGVFGVIEMYKPEKLNSNIRPQYLYILVQNGHCYKLNDNMKEFCQKIFKSNSLIEDDIKKVDLKYLKNEYQIRNTEFSNYDVEYIDDLDDIVDIMNDEDEQEEETAKRFIYDGDIEKLLLEMVRNKNSYIPNVVMDCGRIQSLSFKVGKVTGIIKPCSDKDTTQKDISLSNDIYKAYHDRG